MNPRTSRDAITSPTPAAKPAASDLERRLRSLGLKVHGKLAGVPFASFEKLHRAVHNEFHRLLDESICTRDEYYGDAAAIVGELVCELFSERGAADKRASSPRAPRRSGGTKSARAGGCAGADAAASEDPPPGDVPPVGEDGPPTRAQFLDVEALVAAHVERAVAPILDENRRLRAQIAALSAASSAPLVREAVGAEPHLPRHQVMGWTELTKAAQERGVRNDAGGTLTPAAVRNGVRRGFGRLAELQRHCVNGGVAREAACRMLAEIAVLPAAPRVAQQDRGAAATRNRWTA